MNSVDPRYAVEDLSFVELDGPGVPLLMIHGNSSSQQAFEKQVTYLRGKRRLLLVDLPGHGSSSRAARPADYTIESYAGVLHRRMELQGVHRYAVLGASLGGYIALKLAELSSGIVGIALIGTAPFEKTAESAAKAFLPGPALTLSGQEQFSASDVEAFIDVTDMTDDVGRTQWRQDILRTDPAARSAMVAGLMSPTATAPFELARTFAGPISVIAGASDSSVSLSFIADFEFRSLWRDAVQLVPGGHTAYWTHPDQFNRVLAAFLRDLDEMGAH